MNAVVSLLLHIRVYVQCINLHLISKDALTANPHCVACRKITYFILTIYALRQSADSVSKVIIKILLLNYS